MTPHTRPTRLQTDLIEMIMHAPITTGDPHVKRLAKPDDLTIALEQLHAAGTITRCTVGAGSWRRTLWMRAS